MFLSKIISFVWIISAGVLASPRNNLYARAPSSFNPDSVRDTVCDDPNAKIDYHDANVALLQICGGIAKEIQKCQGKPTSTEGRSGTALFTLNPEVEGAFIIISKGRWEGCIRAVRAKCGSGSFHSICKGGTTDGDLKFSLVAV